MIVRRKRGGGGIYDEVTRKEGGARRINRRSRGGGGVGQRGATQAGTMTNMTKNWVPHTSTSDKKDEDYDTINAMVKCGLLYWIVGGIIQSVLQYKSNIGPKLPFFRWVSMNIDP